MEVLINILQAAFALLPFLSPILLYSNPSNVSHIDAGDAYVRSFDDERALQEYLLAYNDSPSDFNPLVRLVRVYGDIGIIRLRTGTGAEQYYRLAAQYADSLMQYYPDSAQSHFWFALARGSLIPFVGIREKLAIGREVREHIETAIRIDSTFAYPYVVQGVFEREAAQLSWFERGIARVIFGAKLSGSLEESKRCLQKALHFDSKNTFAYFELYQTSMALDDPAGAGSALEHLLTIPPKNLRERLQRDEGKRLWETFIKSHRPG